MADEDKDKNETTEEPQAEAEPFFFNDTAATEIYTLSLPDALPISASPLSSARGRHAQTAQ